jgi:hypothetical protein
MAATISGRIVGWQPFSVKTSERRFVLVGIRFVIEDGADREAFFIKERYPAIAFQGLTTPAEVRTRIRNDGFGAIPPMRDVALGLLQHWNDTAVLRAIPLPFDLGTVVP